MKVLDFGLAKIADDDHSPTDVTRAAGLTHAEGRPGAVMGTAAYMSPEQARGLQVDKRTDIWAFGCVLYEMVTGRAAFAGDTFSDTIARILEREPDWSACPPRHPRSSDGCCFAASRRTRSTGCGTWVTSASRSTRATTCRRAPRKERSRLPLRTRSFTRWLPWAALVALAARSGFARPRARRPCRRTRSPTRSSLASRIGRAPKGAPRSRPTGGSWPSSRTRTARSASGRARWAPGASTNLTPDMPLYAPATLQRNFGFSGDGAEIWLSPSGNASRPEDAHAADRRSFTALPGRGHHHPLLVSGWHSAGLHDDLRGWPRFAVGRRRRGRGCPGDRARPGRRCTITTRSGHRTASGSTSRAGWTRTSAMDVWRVRPSGGPPERISRKTRRGDLPGATRPAHAALCGARRGQVRPVAVVARRGEPGRTPGERGPRAVHLGGGQPRWPASGRHRGQPHRQPLARATWRPVADERDVEPYPVPTVRALAPRFGGASLFHLSTGGVDDGLWRMQDGQSFLVRNGTDPALFEPPAVSRDGRRVAVVHRRDGKRQLGAMASGRHGLANPGAPPSKFEARPTGRPTASWIATGGSDGEEKGLFKIPVAGGAPVRLVSGQAFNPAWSPKGDLIVYTAAVGGNVPLLGVRPDGGPVTCPPNGSARAAYRFLPDGTGTRVPAAQRCYRTSGGSIWPRRNLAVSPTSTIAARYRRSTSPPTGSTSCSTARARTRTSS